MPRAARTAVTVVFFASGAGLLAAAGMTLALGVGGAVAFLAEAIRLRAALSVLIGLCVLIAALAGSTRVA